MTREEAERQVREECRRMCRALICEREERCFALLYDTPGFYAQMTKLMEDAART